MLQTKFNVEQPHVDFLNNFKTFGFKDKSSLVRTAIEHFKKEKELELKELKNSAELYLEIYTQDSELRELTESAINEWPE